MYGIRNYPDRPRIFATAADRSPVGGHSRNGRAGQGDWVPAVDICETEGALTFSVELPGVRPEDVEVTAEEGILTIHGVRTACGARARTSAITWLSAATGRSCADSNSLREWTRTRSRPTSRRVCSRCASPGWHCPSRSGFRSRLAWRRSPCRRRRSLPRAVRVRRKS